ncbi:MAG: SRPBCC domain-containing protein [Rhizobiales bacterium]|nr:SRPBCC domain-containing protein [Hyphomicrobiales bacterium]MBO6699910.1 SRPBCC domain-containing protein [Hyphomicrobiales bacterium]MBO6737448.1 SRPBCC domain-containing protein [Hyphomicrobiales bacterium]MBO6911478.1 SRPBCC domain-containing protein [Hyphomicrobiales bacterium]MBO6955222.1 SRPBCC domain-containing protein [Hyphomicrobiales bacterium]
MLMKPMNDGTDTSIITKTVFFAASRETVWSFLTDKSKLGTWFHLSDADLALGENYTLYRIDDAGNKVPQIYGEVLEMDAPNRLVTTFCIEPFGDKSTTVTWVLEEAAGGTRLHLTHEGVREAAGEITGRMLLALDAGWDEHFASLRKAVAA